MIRVLPAFLLAIAIGIVDAAPAADPVWRVVSRLTPPAEGVYSEFGAAVAYVEQDAVVSAPFTAIRDLQSGSTFPSAEKVLVFPSASTISSYQLIPGVSRTYFGKSIGVSGGRVIIGAQGSDFEGSSGAAYVVDVTTGEQLAVLRQSGDTFLSRYGSSVALQGDIAAVGDTQTSFFDDGYVELFNISDETLRATLVPPEDRRVRWFGSSVALTDTQVFVGAERSDVDAQGSSGSVFIYDVETATLASEIVPPEPYISDFGADLDIDGDRIIVGSPNSTIFTDNEEIVRSLGAAHVFDLTSGEVLYSLLPDDLHEAKYFGRSVAIQGDLALVGAYGDDERGNFAGAAYLFDLTAGEQIAKLTAPDGHEGARFGWSVDLNESRALIGAPLTIDPESYGVTYEFQAVLPGDYNGDGLVSTEDHAIWTASYGSQTGDLLADGNGNGRIDAADYTLWRDAFQPPANQQTVPEPSMLLLTASCLGLLRLSRFHQA